MRRSADVSPSSTSLFAFKPRQVLLLEQQQRSQAASAPMAKNKPEKAAELKPEDDSILTFSVALWLENKGLSKVLKRFLSATQIQDDNWKAKALNLNEIFSKYQEIRSAHEDLKKNQKQEQVVSTTEKNGDENGTSEEIPSKKKKKKSKGDVAVNDKGGTLEVASISEKNESYVNGNEAESCKASGPINHDQNTESAKESNGDIIVDDQSSKKKKEKNKKKSKLTDVDEKQTDVMPEVIESKDKGSLSKSSAAELLESEITAYKKSKKKSSEGAEDGVNESKKASKKRKRMGPDEDENQSGKEVPVEESKSKKSKGLEVSKDDLQKTAVPGANGHAGELAKGVTSEAVLADSENLSVKQSDESIKNTVNSNGMDKSGQKSANRQPKSSEPKTVKAFQRVKADEVEFVDERLQDNSYWAKDGAETGYGAKAQEVLGQVKGRDFRHEKTKKKRGSYRGGQIDLHSHSIKFNYSDEE